MSAMTLFRDLMESDMLMKFVGRYIIAAIASSLAPSSLADYIFNAHGERKAKMMGEKGRGGWGRGSLIWQAMNHILGGSEMLQFCTHPLYLASLPFPDFFLQTIVVFARHYFLLDVLRKTCLLLLLVLTVQQCLSMMSPHPFYPGGF